MREVSVDGEALAEVLPKGGVMAHPFFDANTFPWIRADAKALHELLVTAIPSNKEIAGIFQRAGGELGDLDQSQPPRAIWQDVLNQLATAGMLRALLDELKAIGRLRASTAFQAAIRDIEQARPAIEAKDARVNFLDRKIADFSDPGLSALHEVLIRAYDDEVAALALAGQVGLLRADIARNPKLRYTWVSILEEAAKEGQLRRLVDLAVRDPTVAGFHAGIREAISIPSGPVATNEVDREPSTALEAGQHPGIGERALLWEPGSTLVVRFLDGAPAVRTSVEVAASKWLEYANLHFDFGGGADAPIRVSFKQAGSWAYQGRLALSVGQDEPTVNFGWIDADTDKKEVERVVMHEFGHVLGLQHEQGNPASTIDWDRPAVYRDLTGPPNYWTRQQVDQSIFAIWPPGYFPVHKVFDRQSIMMFPQSAGHLLKGRPIGWNYRLSPIDKQFAAALYPLWDAR